MIFIVTNDPQISFRILLNCILVVLSDTLDGNHFLKYNKNSRILISFNCFSEYISPQIQKKNLILAFFFWISIMRKFKASVIFFHFSMFRSKTEPKVVFKHELLYMSIPLIFDRNIYVDYVLYLNCQSM